MKVKIEMIIWGIVLVLALMFALNYKVVFGSGKSMLPTIKEKQILLCKKQKDYKVNDIVFFKLNGIPVVHRIINVVDYGNVKAYTTKGDGNDSADMFGIYKENIVCRVVK